MRKLLFVIPAAGHGGAATQLNLIARGLPRDRFEVRVCVLGSAGPAVQLLSAAGVSVEVLNWTRLVDLSWLRQLRRLLGTFRPDVVHAWRLPAVKAVLLAGRGAACLLANDAISWRGNARRPSRMDRWLCRRVNRVVAAGDAEAGRYRALGVPARRITVIPPAVSHDQPLMFREPASIFHPQDRVLVGVGPLEPHKGFRDAVWAMGILRFLPADPHLVLIGTGSDRARLEEFARATEVADRVHFVGEQGEVGPLLARADVVWVPSRAAGGHNVALEAMAAGRPVLAARLPDLAELIVDGETGFLFSPGDKVALARQTRVLLDDADLRGRLGEGGRRRVVAQFAVEDVLARWQALYEGASHADAVRTRSA